MPNNYRFGSRDMARAARYAMQAEAREGRASFSTAATVADRFSKFAQFAKENGVKWLERVERGDLAASTAQNLVSAVNTVMTTVTRGSWGSVSPTKACGIEQRSAIRSEPINSLDREKVSLAAQIVFEHVSERAGVVIELARDLGLRSSGRCQSRHVAGQGLEKLARRRASRSPRDSSGSHGRSRPA